MKKAGIIISLAGFITCVISGVLFYLRVINPFAFYMSMVAGFILTPLGLSFLAFSLPEKRRKKIANRSLIISLVLIVAGLICVELQVIGARLELIFGVVILCFYYGSLSFKNKFEKWKVYARSKRDAFFLSLFDFVGIGSLVLGVLFKFQNWPGATLMATLGLIILAIGMIAWNQKFKSEVVFRKETEDKLKISLQKIEESHKEISDSINYAKRLQDAILPKVTQITSAFPDSFVLYKPKAIVAGDFYWFEQKNGMTFLAAADCTGHGVPGAIVSVVCSNALNRAVLEMNLTDPGKILDKVTELVLETFQKSGDEVKDGMDISLLSVEFGVVSSEIKNSNSPNSKPRTPNFSWAGANNPLWIVRKNQLIEIKGDKQPVGLHDNRKPFTSHKVKVEKGDALYLFTDGYADQFGGEKGKKFKYRQISEKLIAINEEKMEAQKEMLNSIFEEWKSDLEQVDDVCVIGIRI